MLRFAMAPEGRNGGELGARIARALADRGDVLDAYLFGSRARGDAAAHSDVDVAVYVDERRSPAAPFGVAADIASVLMSALGESRVDVVVLNHAPPLLYHRVVRDGIRVLARDVAAATTREGRALSRFCDYVPQLAKIDAARRAASGR
jgi:hypothetical protein